MAKNLFKQVGMPSLQRSTFNMSFDHKTTFDMGQMIPIFHYETLPTDYWEITPEILLRCAPLVAPVMHEVEVRLHVFHVPKRILWSGWEDFITGTDEGAVNPPTMAPNGSTTWPFTQGSLADYFGLPTGSGQMANLTINIYSVAAYYMIYDHYYRDQNIIAEKYVALGAGDNNGYDALMTAVPLKCAWAHDYFTSALDETQAGDEVTLPLLQGGSVDVVSKGAGNVSGNLFRGVSDFVLSTSDSVSSGGSGTIEVGAQGTHTIDPNGDWEVDINSEASTITTLRRAFKLQEFLERDKRGGQRYQENLMSHWGSTIEDYRVNEPEYVGGSKGSLVISEVLSTAQTVASSVEYSIGQMAGHGISLAGGNKITYKAKEHGELIGILTVRPRPAYFQQLHKKWRHNTRLDYPWPEFAHIGDEEIYNWEVYPNQTDETKREQVFGYTPRYSSWKFQNGITSGKMRTSDLEFWNLNRKFTSEPGLNEAFIECNPSKRIFVDSDEPGIYAHCIFNAYVNRALPYFGNPKL